MSLRKRCSAVERPMLADGSANPTHCGDSPRCAHPWHLPTTGICTSGSSMRMAACRTG
jgi:hypothetical protein